MGLGQSMKYGQIILFCSLCLFVVCESFYAEYKLLNTLNEYVWVSFMIPLLDSPSEKYCAHLFVSEDGRDGVGLSFYYDTSQPGIFEIKEYGDLECNDFVRSLLFKFGVVYGTGDYSVFQHSEFVLHDRFPMDLDHMPQQKDYFVMHYFERFEGGGEPYCLHEGYNETDIVRTRTKMGDFGQTYHCNDTFGTMTYPVSSSLSITRIEYIRNSKCMYGRFRNQIYECRDFDYVHELGVNSVNAGDFISVDVFHDQETCGNDDMMQQLAISNGLCFEINRYERNVFASYFLKGAEDFFGFLRVGESSVRQYFGSVLNIGKELQLHGIQVLEAFTDPGCNSYYPHLVKVSQPHCEIVQGFADKFRAESTELMTKNLRERGNYVLGAPVESCDILNHNKELNSFIKDVVVHGKVDYVTSLSSSTCYNSDFCLYDSAENSSSIKFVKCDGGIEPLFRKYEESSHCEERNDHVQEHKRILCIPNTNYNQNSLKAGLFFCPPKLCFGKLSTEKDVCNGRGKCLKDDKCECNGLYTGKECEIDSAYMIIFSSVFVVVGCCISSCIYLCVCCLVCCGTIYGCCAFSIFDILRHFDIQKKRLIDQDENLRRKSKRRWDSLHSDKDLGSSLMCLEEEVPHENVRLFRKNWDDDDDQVEEWSERVPLMGRLLEDKVEFCIKFYRRRIESKTPPKSHRRMLFLGHHRGGKREGQSAGSVPPWEVDVTSSSSRRQNSINRNIDPENDENRIDLEIYLFIITDVEVRMETQHTFLLRRKLGSCRFRDLRDVHLIGKGNFGRAYSCRVDGVDETLVLKIPLFKTDKPKSSLVKEGISFPFHPNLVMIHRFLRHDSIRTRMLKGPKSGEEIPDVYWMMNGINTLRNHPMFLMKFHYMDLCSYIEERNYELTIVDVLWILHGLISGGHHLFKQQIVHRDLHMGNIFVDMNEKKGSRILIGDYGCALDCRDSTTEDWYFLKVFRDRDSGKFVLECEGSNPSVGISKYSNMYLEYVPPEIRRSYDLGKRQDVAVDMESVVVNYQTCDSYAVGIVGRELLGLKDYMDRKNVKRRVKLVWTRTKDGLMEEECEGEEDDDSLEKEEVIEGGTIEKREIVPEIEEEDKERGLAENLRDLVVSMSDPYPDERTQFWEAEENISLFVERWMRYQKSMSQSQ